MDSYRKMYNETKATSEEATHKVTIELATFFLFLLLVMLGSASLNQLQFWFQNYYSNNRINRTVWSL